MSAAELDVVPALDRWDQRVLDESTVKCVEAVMVPVGAAPDDATPAFDDDVQFTRSGVVQSFAVRRNLTPGRARPHLAYESTAVLWTFDEWVTVQQLLEGGVS